MVRGPGLQRLVPGKAERLASGRASEASLCSVPRQPLLKAWPPAPAQLPGGVAGERKARPTPHGLARVSPSCLDRPAGGAWVCSLRWTEWGERPRKGNQTARRGLALPGPRTWALLRPSRQQHGATQDGRGSPPGRGAAGGSLRPAEEQSRDGAVTRARRGVTGQARALKDHPAGGFSNGHPQSCRLPRLMPGRTERVHAGSRPPASQQLYPPVAKRWGQPGGTVGAPCSWVRNEGTGLRGPWSSCRPPVVRATTLQSGSPPSPRMHTPPPDRAAGGFVRLGQERPRPLSRLPTAPPEGRAVSSRAVSLQPRGPPSLARQSPLSFAK